MEDSGRTIDEHLAELAARPETYAGFNLLLFAPRHTDHAAGITFDACLASNLGGGGPIVHRPLQDDERRCGGVSNGADRTDEWPKVSDARRCLQSALDSVQSKQDGDANLVDSLFQLLS